jgi:hypothetical protein
MHIPDRRIPPIVPIVTIDAIARERLVDLPQRLT